MTVDLQKKQQMRPRPAVVGDELLSIHRELYYGGVWHAASGGASTDLVNPATGQALGQVANADAVDVDKAVWAAHQAFLEWKRVKPAERARMLKVVAQCMREHTDELGWIESIDGGFPYHTARGEAAAAADVIDYFTGLYTEMKGETIPMGDGVLNYAVREPFGVVARINAFNHPVMFAGMKLAPALMAGNAVIVKPADQAPLSVLRLAELLDGILPPGVFNVLTGGVAAGDALVRHPLVPRIGVIGSIKTGQAVLRAAADGIKRVTLELGGKNALIAFPDADPEKVAAAAVFGMSLERGCGQACSSNTRLFLHEAIYDATVEAIAERLASLRVGLPTEEATQVGCLVSHAQQERVLNYIRSGIEQGATPVVGGRAPGGALADGAFVEPTLFTNVTPEMTIAQEEIFGPVMAALRWRDEEAMFDAVNGVDYGLAASIWTKDLAAAHRAAERVDVGYVWINGTLVHLLGAQFGGRGKSGLGVEECLEELISYTQPKNVHLIFNT